MPSGSVDLAYQFIRTRGIWLLVACIACTCPARGATAYREGAASGEGIGKFYEGREIAQVMGFEGTEWLERPTREREERTDVLVEELGLRPGMMVADVGAGSGYLTRRMAPLIGTGKVYAVDVQPEMVELLRKQSRKTGLTNVIPILCANDNSNLPSNSIDLAIMVDVYHELAFPQEMMHSIVAALKPGGRVVFVEYRGEDPAVPIKRLHKMSKAQIVLEMRKFPLQLERSSERLPLQHILVFQLDTLKLHSDPAMLGTPRHQQRD